MSHSHDIPQTQARNNDIISGSADHFLIPSPVPTRRSRTFSASQRAAEGPQHHGVVKSFCRQRGHGFIQPVEGTDPLFVHISDIEGEYVPKEGDEVSYKTTSMPPQNKKRQAVHVKITHLNPGVSHEKWDSPVKY